jgi:RNA polymerase sigma factor (sigma-70 family)
LAAVPSIGRASRIEGAAPAEAELTRALYEQYANQIFRYCLHQLGSREEAEDAVQSTFLNAFRGIKRGIVPELESAWLFKIAHNVCLSRRRSSWRRGRVESPADFEVVEELAPAPSRRADELIGLQDVLEEMPESQRRAILLREWQGLSYREIAEELDLSQAAVETLIFRARRTLASGLERPPERRRIARVLDWGNAVTALKSLVVGGSAAAKVAATVAAVSATTVVAAGPLEHHRSNQQASTPVATHGGGPASAPKPAGHVEAAVAPAPVVSHRHPQQKTVAKARTHRPAAATTAAKPSAAGVSDPDVSGAARQVVQQAPAAAAAHARNDGRHAARSPKHRAPAQHPAVQEPPAGGTNPAGKEKDHGRWARGEQPAADSSTPAPVPPAAQVQPAAVPNGKANGKDK